MSDWVDVAAADDFVAGQAISVEVDGAVIAVFRLDDGFFAIEDLCTHDGGRLTGGTVQGDEIVCPRHGARFCLRTGAAKSAPAYEPTATLPVRVAAGIVQVRDNRWD
jgi:3-phenylpropionate/trans-cinnamate dioxygenase ferredoxin subunit